MDKEIFKLFPQKAFKLLSIKESIKITGLVSSSLLNKQSYNDQFQKRLLHWKLKDVTLQSENLPFNNRALTKEAGEKILSIYFSQFFENDLAIHLDYRHSFVLTEHSLLWKPSKLHYKFTNSFIDGIKDLYQGFYLNNNAQFELGLTTMGILKKGLNETEKNEVIELFTKYFGQGKVGTVHFSLKELQNSFNEIFSFFIKKDIPLNPEFAVLGLALVTLYSVLQEIPEALDVKSSFLSVSGVI
jgi:hypothetical protein